MATPPGRPEGGDLKAAEKKAVDSVHQHTEQGGAEDGLAAYRSAYSQFAKTHTPQEAQQFVRDTMEHFKQDGLSPALAAAFGFGQETGKDPADRIHSATVDALAQSKNPIDAALAQELKGHLNDWNSQKIEGGVTLFGHNFGGSATDGVTKRDLFNQLASYDHGISDHTHSPMAEKDPIGDSERNAINHGLLEGGPNSLFERVYKSTGRPHDPLKPDEDPLNYDDFAKYLDDNQKTLSSRDKGYLEYTLKNWDNEAFHPLEPTDELSGTKELTQRSIRDGVDTMASESAISRDVGKALTAGGNNSVFAQIARSLGRDPATATLTESDFEHYRDEHKDQLGPNELNTLHRTLLAFRNGKLGELDLGGDIENPKLSLKSIQSGIDLTNYSPY
jgi:hypothetical protein